MHIYEVNGYSYSAKFGIIFPKGSKALDSLVLGRLFQQVEHMLINRKIRVKPCGKLK